MEEIPSTESVVTHEVFPCLSDCFHAIVSYVQGQVWSLVYVWDDVYVEIIGLGFCLRKHIVSGTGQV
jgi:hypothetical protein